MSIANKSITKFVLAALYMSALAFSVPAMAQTPAQPDALNMQLVGASQNKGQTDIGFPSSQRKVRSCCGWLPQIAASNTFTSNK